MQPDIRSAGLLTHDILESSPAWAIVHEKQTFIVHPDDVRGDVVKSDGESRDVIAIQCIGREVSLPFNQCKCYPCEPLPPFKPVPWPMLPGEEEIKEWRGMAPGDDCLPTELDGMWDLENDAGYTVAPLGVPINGRDGMHPAPRIGDTGPVWVWEVDR